MVRSYIAFLLAYKIITKIGVPRNPVTADNGIGSISIVGEITGKNNIKCGIGEVNIGLCGREDIDFDYEPDGETNYNLKVNTVSGDINIKSS